jgi:hypothetical protein
MEPSETMLQELDHGEIPYESAQIDKANAIRIS